MIIQVKGGYKIKLESGKLLPKIYSSKAKAQRRIIQMKVHSSKKGE